MNDNTAGWVKIHRSFFEWEWYGDTNCVRLALHFILKANYQPRKWEGITIERGQLVTTRAKLVSELNLTDQQIRTAIEKLTTSEFATKTATKTYTLITICKYDTYQAEKESSNQDSNQRITNEQPTNNQRITNEQPIDNNYKEYKEVKESLSYACAHATREEKERFFEIFFFRNFIDPIQEVDRFVNNYEASGWVRKNGQQVTDREALARAWTEDETSRKLPRRFSADFLKNWRILYNNAKGKDPAAARLLIRGLRSVKFQPGIITLFGSQEFGSLIDTYWESYFVRFFDKYFNGLTIQKRTV